VIVCKQRPIAQADNVSDIVMPCRLAVGRGDGHVSIHDPERADVAQSAAAQAAQQELKLRAKQAKQRRKSCAPSGTVAAPEEDRAASSIEGRLNGTVCVLGAAGEGHMASVGALTCLSAGGSDTSEVLISGGNDRQLIIWDVFKAVQINDKAASEAVMVKVAHGRKVNGLCTLDTAGAARRVIVADTSRRLSVYHLQ
jgi:regulator of RNase E activity RraA